MYYHFLITARSLYIDIAHCTAMTKVGNTCVPAKVDKKDTPMSHHFHITTLSDLDDAGFTKVTPYHTLTCDLWGVYYLTLMVELCGIYCEYFALNIMCQVGSQPRTNLTKLWAHNWNLVKNSHYFNYNFNDQIMSQFRTSWQLSCHDMCKIVTWSVFFFFFFSSNDGPNFMRFGSWAHKPFVKWTPRTWCPLYELWSSISTVDSFTVPLHISTIDSFTVPLHSPYR